MELIRVEHINKKYKEWVRIEWNMGKRCNFDCSYCDLTYTIIQVTHAGKV